VIVTESPSSSRPHDTAAGGRLSPRDLRFERR
jgi:hypothetical protein